MKFVDVTNDVAFRKIFGNQKKTAALVSFLNAVLELEGDKQVESVKIMDPNQFPRLMGEKASIVDIKAKDLAGRQFLVEMQVASQEGFAKRVQYYAFKDYSLQINQGEDYKLLQPTFFIAILDFNFGESEDYLSHHLLVDGKTFEHLLKDIRFTFIQLPKFNKNENELRTSIDQWTYFIKNAENLDFIPEDVEDPGLVEAYKEAEKYTWDREELRVYDLASMAIQDARGMLEFAENNGIRKGIDQGIDIGMQKERNAIILKFHKQGKIVKEISELLEISEEEVQRVIDAD